MSLAVEMENSDVGPPGDHILGPNEDGGSTGKKKEIYVTGRATLMNLISQTDFYSPI